MSASPRRTVRPARSVVGGHNWSPTGRQLKRSQKMPRGPVTREQCHRRRGHVASAPRDQAGALGGGLSPTLDVANQRPAAVRPDANDHGQHIGRDVPLVDRPGAAGRGGDECLQLGIPRGEATLAVLSCRGSSRHAAKHLVSLSWVSIPLSKIAPPSEPIHGACLATRPVPQFIARSGRAFHTSATPLTLPTACGGTHSCPESLGTGRQRVNLRGARFSRLRGHPMSLRFLLSGMAILLILPGCSSTQTPVAQPARGTAPTGTQTTAAQPARSTASSIPTSAPPAAAPSLNGMPEAPVWKHGTEWTYRYGGPAGGGTS